MQKSGGADENALRDLKFSRSGAKSEQILLSERATAYFILENSQFLAFAKCTSDKMQLVKITAAVLFSSLAVINSVVIQLAKVLQPADMDLKFSIIGLIGFIGLSSGQQT